MKKLFLFVFGMALAVGLSGQARAAKEQPGTDEVMTAIDVADMIRSGYSYADIAKLLSDKRGFDRASALKKGKTDQKIVEDLVINADNSKNVVDKNKLIVYKSEGDNYYKNSQYDKAAKEYSLAIKYSRDNYEPYKLRGDSYKQYLVTDKKYSARGNEELFKKSRTFVCSAISSDYAEAGRLIKATMARNKSALDALKFKMDPKNLKSRSEKDVAPNRQNASENISGMREMDGVYRSQRAAYQAEINIRKALVDYKSVCGEGAATNPELKTTEKQK